MPLESYFQSDLIKELKKRFPEAIILKNDPNYLQGFPDVLILYEDRWAVLETKRGSGSSHRPNQNYYVEKANEMSFGAFISPENKEQVLDELQQAFRNRRPTRLPGRF